MNKKLIFAITLLSTLATVHADPIGKVLLSGDEWEFSERAFEGWEPMGYAPNAEDNQLLLNHVFDFMSSDQLGTGKILSLEIPDHVDLGVHFDNTAASYGFSVTRSFAEDNLSNYGPLNQYSLIQLTYPYASTSAELDSLASYVAAGGHLLIRGGVGGPEAAHWSPLISQYGLSLGSNLVPPVFPENVSITGGYAPFITGVSTFTWSNGFAVTASGPYSSIAVNGPDFGLMGMYVAPHSEATPEPATLTIMAAGSGVMALRRKRRTQK